MNKKILKWLHISLFFSFFIGLILYNHKTIISAFFEDKNILLNRMTKQLISQDGLNIDYKLKIKTGKNDNQLIEVNGESIIDIKNKEQSGNIDILADGFSINMLSGSYYMNEKSFYINIPQLLEEPYCYKYNNDIKFNKIDQSLISIGKLFIQNQKTKYEGRQAVNIINQNNRKYKEWLYKIKTQINIRELFETLCFKGLLEDIKKKQILPFDNFNDVELIIYVNNALNIRKIELQTTKDNNESKIELIVNLNVLKKEEIHVNTIKYD